MGRRVDQEGNGMDAHRVSAALVVLASLLLAAPSNPAASSDGTLGPLGGVVGPPSIVDTNPPDSGIVVRLDTPIWVNFSESMDVKTVTWSLLPNLALSPTWSNENMTLLLIHAVPFSPMTVYTMAVTGGKDVDEGLDLVAGPVPNPWTFTTAGSAGPHIVATDPADGETHVPLDHPITVWFSEPMNMVEVTVSILPTLTITLAWDAPFMVLTIGHPAPFAQCWEYTVMIDATSLVPGPVPNPWTFTTMCSPAVSLLVPAGGESWSGGSTHTIQWTMDDADDDASNLTVWVNYTSSDGSGPVAGPLGGPPPPYATDWTLPSIDALDVVLCVEVLDPDGNHGSDCSGAFEIDSTAPTVVTTSPHDGATEVAVSADIVITFLEAMAGPATNASISVVPSPGSLVFWWNPGQSILTITHAPFDPNATYAITVGTGAVDDSDPGNRMLAPHTFSFVTVFGTAPPRPNRPTNLHVVEARTTWITFAWTPPWQYEDGTPLAQTDIRGYFVYRARGGGTWLNLTMTDASTPPEFTDTGLDPDTLYYYRVVTVLWDGRISTSSATLPAWTLPGALPPTPTDYGVLWAWSAGSIAAATIVATLLVVFFLRRKARPREPTPDAPPPSPGVGGGLR